MGKGFSYQKVNEFLLGQLYENEVKKVRIRMESAIFRKLNVLWLIFASLLKSVSIINNCPGESSKG